MSLKITVSFHKKIVACLWMLCFVFRRLRLCSLNPASRDVSRMCYACWVSCPVSFLQSKKLKRNMNRPICLSFNSPMPHKKKKEKKKKLSLCIPNYQQHQLHQGICSSFFVVHLYLSFKFSLQSFETMRSDKTKEQWWETWCLWCRKLIPTLVYLAQSAPRAIRKYEATKVWVCVLFN